MHEVLDLHVNYIPDVHTAECVTQDVDPEIFFSNDLLDIAVAVGMCAMCDVKVQCLNYALEHDQKEGIWGGTTPLDRKRMTPAAKAKHLKEIRALQKGKKGE